MKRFISVFFLIFTGLVLQAQDGHVDYPVIGRQIPRFHFSDVSHYTSKSLSSDDLRGKHVILDFWSRYCSSCIASFPKVNALQEKFSDSLQVILVGYNNVEYIKALYERLKKRYSLNLIAAYDTTVFKQFRVEGVPHLIWIDDHGEVKAITTSNELNELNVSRFLNGEQFKFEDKSYDYVTRIKDNFDKKKPFLLGGNGGGENDYLYRSILAVWKRGMPSYGNGPITDRTRSIEYVKIGLSSLFQNAYLNGLFGDMGNTIYKKIILETRDSLRFLEDSAYYCYSLTTGAEVPAGKQLLKILQDDLRNYFGYEAKVERRKLPCYKLVMVDRNKIKRLFNSRESKSKPGLWDRQVGGRLYDLPLKAVAQNLTFDLVPSLNVYDESGVFGKVSVEIFTDITNFDEVRSALRYYGLDLILGTKEQDVLVISDLQ